MADEKMCRCEIDAELCRPPSLCSKFKGYLCHNHCEYYTTQELITPIVEEERETNKLRTWLYRYNNIRYSGYTLRIREYPFPHYNSVQEQEEEEQEEEEEEEEGLGFQIQYPVGRGLEVKQYPVLDCCDVGWCPRDTLIMSLTQHERARVMNDDDGDSLEVKARDSIYGINEKLQH